MTWSAAFPGATVRVLRAVVGRRALQVGLLVGGLFVLGFLCGEQAHAADGIGALPGRTVGQLVNPPAGPTATPTRTDGGRDTDAPKGRAPRPAVPGPTASEPDAEPDTEPGTESGTDALTRPDDDKVIRPVTEDVVGAVVGGVVQPVGDLVKTVTTGLTETVGIPAQPTLPEWPTVPQWPTVPSLPEDPSWPTLPTVPGVPTVPGLPGTPGQTLPAPAPDPSASQPQPGDHAARKPAGDEGSAGGGAGFGPRFAGHGTVIEPVAPHSAHRATSTAHGPEHQAPSDSPGGALGGKSAVDNGSSRHSDAHAVTPDHRAPLRLVPGAAASVGAAGTRDRHRDIPVFPG
ncbi:hypothetical protein ACIP2Y_23680 [Streptomyces sviceus]|uniref:hypothetical protein n=1 Tax=Streptomyces sviceus TaxID=285530 RepID=UPI0038019EFF